jgi:hypothetical protein
LDIPKLAQPGKLKFQPRPIQLELAISLLVEGYGYAAAVHIVMQTMREFGIIEVNSDNLVDLKQAILCLSPSSLELN